MHKHNFAAYKTSTFSIDISNLEFDKAFYAKKDIPAFMHEYCHYIQDLTTISSILGFSLWLRDVVALTQIFCDGANKDIQIPLSRDQHGETINKFRKFYNIYCGNADDVFEIDFSTTSFIKRHLTNQNISLDGEDHIIGVNELEIENRSKKLYFGLIVLQEIQAYYAQQLAEKKLPDTEFTVKSEQLPSYPYKFGYFLFDEFDIEIDLETKFILIDLCLDTIQSPSVFLEVLDKLKGKKVTYFGNSKLDIVEIVEECRKLCSHSKEFALENIIPDLEKWSNGPGRKHLSQSIGWYLKEIRNVYKIKAHSKTFFSMAFILPWQDFARFYSIYAPPILMNDNIQNRSVSTTSTELDNIYKNNFDNATTIWAHRVLYDLLCSENLNQINNRCKCPLYENCTIRLELDVSYICKSAPWEIVKGKKMLYVNMEWLLILSDYGRMI